MPIEPGRVGPGQLSVVGDIDSLFSLNESTSEVQTSESNTFQGKNFKEKSNYSVTRNDVLVLVFRDKYIININYRSWLVIDDAP